MPYPLALLARRAGKNRRPTITLRPITPTTAMALDLATIMVRVPRVWHDATARVLAAYDALLAIRETGTVRDAPGDDLEAALSEAQREALVVIAALQPDLQTWIVRAEAWHRAKFAAGVEAGTGAKVGPLLLPEGETIAAYFQRMLGLIRNVDDTTRANIGDIVWRGFTERTPRDKVAKEIAEAVDVQRKRARRIAIDQSTKLSGRLDQQRQLEAGIEEYEWMHSHKLHPRPVHVARNGSIFRWDTPPADGHPGTQPFCGCKGRAFLRLFDEKRAA